LTVNGGQVLNTQELILGQNATGSGTLNLNGGLVQASAVVPNATPATFVANFNGGTLQAVTNSADFLQVNSMIMSNGLVLDDGGYSVTIVSAPLLAGDAFNGGFIKKGSGAVYLDNSGNTYTGITLVTNGLLAGIGNAPGAVAVGPNGSIGGGDSAGLGTFTAGGDITIQGGAMMRINKDVSANDVVTTPGKITYGGTLVVSNLSTVALASGDKFTLFTPGSHAGNFSNIAGSPGAGLGYSFDPTSGQLSVVVSTIATNPTNITVSASGGNMTLSWPSDHQGWTLQSNAVSLTSSGTWFDYPASTGSRDTTSVTIPVTGTTNSVYFRLKSP
jgi:autotransporter-associated beta strand protein